MARFIAEDVLIVLVSCCSLLFEGGWDVMVLWTCAPCHDIKISILFASFAFARNSWYCSTIPLTGPMAFKKNDFLI